MVLVCLNVANEREVVAVLKLISHTAKNFPGVFYHGKGSAVLPVVARVIPFLANPVFKYVLLRGVFYLPFIVL